MKRSQPLLAVNVKEICRFLVNGLAAALVHYAVLVFNLKVVDLSSAGLANFIAAWFGISASFIGSRTFVFRRTVVPWRGQALRFLALYFPIAMLHGLLLFVWTDVLELDYRLGFLIATSAQVVLSYLGNKLIVFSAP